MDNKKFNLSPVEYNKILKGITLETLFLINSKCEFKPYDKFTDELVIKINEANEFNDKDNRININYKYSLSASPKVEKVKLLNIQAEYLIVLKSKEKFSDDFYDIYKQLSLPINIWPFFREFVNNMTSRMNIPPLTLPLLKR